MVSLKYSFWRPTNTLKTWFRENIRFGELSSTIVFVSLPLSVVDTIAWVLLIQNVAYFLVPRVQLQDSISKVIFFNECNTHCTALTKLI